uniref:RNase H type-1 domain-containing protein n=1 Tax=Oryza glumipatula TaxID=40148 RepID=A0A0D9ZY04_9ORYZ
MAHLCKPWDKNLIRKENSWELPELGWAKINVDGAFCAGSGNAGIGIIIRIVPIQSCYRLESTFATGRRRKN